MPETETAIDAIARYEAFCNGPDGLGATPLEWGDKATPEQVAATEAKFGIALPPSYVSFITERGAFSLDGTRGMIPLKILLESEATDAGGLFPFQWVDDASVANFYAFDPDQARDDAEMPVEVIYHDQVYRPSESFVTFDQHIVWMVRELIGDHEETMELLNAKPAKPSRVPALLAEIAAGASWSLEEIDGAQAVRLEMADGARRLAVLTPDELAELLLAIDPESTRSEN